MSRLGTPANSNYSSGSENRGESNSEPLSSSPDLQASTSQPGFSTLKRKVGPIELKTQTRLNIKVHQLYAVAEWKWNVRDEGPCGICLLPYEARCSQNCPEPEKDCQLAFGVNCPHIFHAHCIAKWGTNQHNDRPPCPNCRQMQRFLGVKCYTR